MIKDIVVNLNVGGCSCKDPTPFLTHSGISRAAAMARLVPSGKAANRMPSIAKNRPIAARKSNIGANSSYWEPGAGDVGEAGGDAAGELAAPGGVCPDGLEK